MTFGLNYSAGCRHFGVLNVGFAFLLFGGLLARAGDIVYVSDPGAGTISEINSNGKESIFASGLNRPEGLALNSAGNLYVADSGAGTISEINSAGHVSTFASGLNGPSALAFGSGGNLFVASPGNRIISKINSSGHASVFAAGITFDSDGDYLATDKAGNVYANTIRTVERFNSTGNPSTVYDAINYVEGMAFNGAGNLYVALQNADGIVGNGGLQTSVFDYPAPYNSNPCEAACADAPDDLAFDQSGNLYATFSELYVPGTTPADGLCAKDVLVEFGVNRVNHIIATDIGGCDIVVQCVNPPAPCVPEPGILTIVSGLAAVLCILRRSDRWRVNQSVPALVPARKFSNRS
ncbi:MAG: NHL repeat-containing protein [Verrucomicrobiota bacterium]|jgi:sugar lactone lactonase YvrE